MMPLFEPFQTQGGARPGGVGEKRPPRGGRDGRCPARTRSGRGQSEMGGAA
jgi:hypothetical protein